MILASARGELLVFSALNFMKGRELSFQD